MTNHWIPATHLRGHKLRRACPCENRRMTNTYTQSSFLRRQESIELLPTLIEKLQENV